MASIQSSPTPEEGRGKDCGPNITLKRVNVLLESKILAQGGGEEVEDSFEPINLR